MCVRVAYAFHIPLLLDLLYIERERERESERERERERGREREREKASERQRETHRQALLALTFDCRELILFGLPHFCQ